jgi:hypothetical protein
MRKTALAGLAGLCALASPTRAAEPCPWRDPGKSPRVFVEERVVTFRQYYTPEWAACVLAQGARAVDIQFVPDGAAAGEPLATEKETLHAGKSDEPRRLQARLFPSNVCDRKARSGQGKLVLSGRPGRERLARLVPVRVRVVATGLLAPLAYTSPVVEIPCEDACGSGGGSARIRSERDGGLVLEAEAERAWFECARRDASLRLLGFAGSSRQEVSAAIRPDFVIDGLERAFAREGERYVLKKPLPTTNLCATGKVWSFEIWGRGELPRMGGGGRSIHELRCR